jgi:hypothetical protein
MTEISLLEDFGAVQRHMSDLGWKQKTIYHPNCEQLSHSNAPPPFIQVLAPSQ